jgi:hypothetical protein
MIIEGQVCNTSFHLMTLPQIRHNTSSYRTEYEMENDFLFEREHLDERLRKLADTESNFVFTTTYVDPYKELEHVETFSFKCEQCGDITEYHPKDALLVPVTKEIVSDLLLAGYDVHLDERDYCPNCRDETHAQFYSTEACLWLCELCGKTTEYAPEERNSLSNARKLFEAMEKSGVETTKKKSDYCQYCGEGNRNKAAHRLIFKIRFSKNESYHVARVYEYADIGCLFAFLAGQNPSPYCSMYLSHMTNRIKRMTGLGIVLP